MAPAFQLSASLGGGSSKETMASVCLDARHFSFSLYDTGVFLKIYIFLFIYFLERERREKDRERDINVWLPLVHPLLEPWPATQACTLDWESNQLSFPLQTRTHALSTPASAPLFSFKLLPQRWSSEGVSLSR